MNQWFLCRSYLYVENDNDRTVNLLYKILALVDHMIDLDVKKEYDFINEAKK